MIMPNTKNTITGDMRVDSLGNRQYYDGTNWLAVIQGPKGDTGACGMMGAIGPQGASGVGSDGSIGHNIKLQSANGERVSVGDIVDFMQIMKQRMLILTPNFEKHEKYPALKEMYEQYQVMERLINDSHNPNV